MGKEYLQITISKKEAPKTKFGKWFYWKVYWNVWCIWKPKFLAWFFGLFISKKTLEELYKDTEIIVKIDDNGR